MFLCHKEIGKGSFTNDVSQEGEGVSQKLTKVDKEGGILSKADVSQLSHFYDQNYDICPLGALFALFERAPKFTRN